MAMTGHTSIDDLAIVGHELAEEHLVLAAGGRLPLPSPRTVQQYISNGPRLFDERYDW